MRSCGVSVSSSRGEYAGMRGCALDVGKKFVGQLGESGFGVCRDAGVRAGCRFPTRRPPPGSSQGRNDVYYSTKAAGEGRLKLIFAAWLCAAIPWSAIFLEPQVKQCQNSCYRLRSTAP